MRSTPRPCATSASRTWRRRSTARPKCASDATMRTRGARRNADKRPAARASPLKRHNAACCLGAIRQVQGVRRLVIVHRHRHVDDDRFVGADIFPAVIEVRPDHKKPRILRADGKYVYLAQCRRAVAAIEHYNLQKPLDDE